MNPEYLALVKIGALLEQKVPGTVLDLEKLIGSGSLTDLVQKTFDIHIHNGEAAYSVLQKILGKYPKDAGRDTGHADPHTQTFS